MHQPSRWLPIAGISLSLDLAFASPALRDCPEDLQPVVMVEQTPIYLSTLVCADTALTFGATTINVTAAPTLLFTSFDATVTSTITPGR